MPSLVPADKKLRSQLLHYYIERTSYVFGAVPQRILFVLRERRAKLHTFHIRKWQVALEG
jgi:hypothetical protein